MLTESAGLVGSPTKFLLARMLRQRAKLAFIYLPIILIAILLGGWFYAAAVALVLALAGFEYGRMFESEARKPAAILIGLGAATFPIARHALGFELTPGLLALVLLFSLIWHLLDYEKGAEGSGTDFAVTTTGIIYIGWLGAYLVSLRDLPQGQWWVMLALPTVWLADMGGYFVGSRFGKRALAPRVSPNKTVEGYVAGIALASVGGGLLTWLWGWLGGLSDFLTPSMGILLGLIISLLAPLGDLGISLFKRELTIKDTGTLLGPHGGALDRMDTWFWTSLISYYFALWIAQ